MAKTPDPPPKSPVLQDRWGVLRNLTNARIALGRAGISQPTEPQLSFQHAHAMARDAVHTPVDMERLSGEIGAIGGEALIVRSAAEDRATYLQRPDLGRRLEPASRQRLRDKAAAQEGPPDIVLVIADGLSAKAIQCHALPLLGQILPRLHQVGLRHGPITLVEQGRVAIADEVGEVLGARVSIILIGERPGLSSPDSLGVYLTYAPRVGRTDAERNCVSNIRPAGLGYVAAAQKIDYLLTEALRRRISGVALKDDAPALAPDEAQAMRNFLTGDG